MKFLFATVLELFLKPGPNFSGHTTQKSLQTLITTNSINLTMIFFVHTLKVNANVSTIAIKIKHSLMINTQKPISRNSILIVIFPLLCFGQYQEPVLYHRLFKYLQAPNRYRCRSIYLQTYECFGDIFPENDIILGFTK